MTVGSDTTAARVLARAFAIALACAHGSCASEGAAASGGAKPEGKPGAHGDVTAAPRGPLAFPVETRPVVARDVQYELDAVGSVDAYERVQVTARVQGVVERVHFSEGEQVKAGQLLAEIEPQRYQVAVRSAQASLERARASKADAEAGMGRREQALAKSPGLIPAEELESWRTKMRLAEAETLSAQAAYDQAALNLRDARVRAPLAGTIETRSVQTGQYAQPGAVLATLVRRDPLLLRFSVAEADASKLSRAQTVGFRVRGLEGSFSAKVSHIAGIADAASRMVPITAEVAAAERDRLRPGAFAEVSVPIVGGGNLPVVPELAVRPSEKGFLAYVVEGGVARERVLNLGMHTSDGQVEVRAGLKVGEQLVVRGAEALKDGTKIKLAPRSPEEKPASAHPELKP
ncbi:MAG TPA: efflux RND transporter periplasmic adaptor subunit [Polyangiales bacterium]|nr:efflux RND transporter periplasmic adaptor subunit [Polyangiales bacterium]